MITDSEKNLLNKALSYAAILTNFALCVIMQTDKGKDLNVMMIKPIGGLTASNAAFNVMGAQQSMLGLLSFAGGGSVNPAFLATQETQLQQSILQNSLMYKLGLAQEKMEKKLQDDSIKRSFSTFA